MSFLIDMSETAAKQDPNGVRTIQPASWVLELFTGGTRKDTSDAFSAFLLHNGQVTADDALFRDVPVEKQVLDSSGKQYGFVRMTEQGKELVSERLAGSFASKIAGTPPLIEATSAASSELRAISSVGGKLEMFPGIVALSLERHPVWADLVNEQ